MVYWWHKNYEPMSNLWHTRTFFFQFFLIYKNNCFFLLWDDPTIIGKKIELVSQDKSQAYVKELKQESIKLDKNPKNPSSKVDFSKKETKQNDEQWTVQWFSNTYVRK